MIGVWSWELSKIEAMHNGRLGRVLVTLHMWS